MKTQRHAKIRFLSLLALQAALLALAGCTSGPVEEASPGGSGKVVPPVPVVREEPAEARPLPRAAEEGVDGSAGEPVVQAEPVADVAVDRDGTAGETAPLPACVPGVDHRAAGRKAWLEGDRETAARELRCAVESGKADPADTYLLGLALWKSGDLDGAAEALAAAAWSLDDPVRARVNLARVRIELGDLPGARAAVQDALDGSPEDADAWNVLGRVLLAAGDRDGAAEAFSRAAELAPENPWPRNNLGYLFLVAGDASRAVGPLEEAVAVDPGLAPAWHNLALARERQGDLPGALAAARRAAELAGGERYGATVDRLAALLPGDRRDAEIRVADGKDRRRGEATVAEVAGAVPSPPAPSDPLPRHP